MALIQCSFYSQTLLLSCQMTVILPQTDLGLATARGAGPGPVMPPQPPNHRGRRGARGFRGYPTLYLLHGISDDHTTWQRRTSIERYVAPLGIAVVMPAVQRSFYTNLRPEGAYWDFLSQEVPALARQFFPLSDRREDNFVAGVSMGGYGALKLALRQPDRWAAAASLSGALDLRRRLREPQPNPLDATVGWAFGSAPAFTGSDNDLLALLHRHRGRGKARLPALYMACGTEDFLYPANQTFRAAAAKAGVELTYEEGPGDHDWVYWDRMIQAVLRWLPLAGKKPA